ncbi:lipase 1-like [Battus philenor]|uniref:lipase 1-like n=1 Tax=Battus philenor TaxID=42288 RepID=UPI0035D0D9FE
MKVYIAFIILCRLLIQKTISADVEDAKLSYKQLATKYGHNTEEYQVTTEDGYKLLLFRIPGRVGLPILLVHGIMDSSDTWIIRGNVSLAITLANQGYDVWTANCRGNKYSKHHVHLKPDSSRYWNFSFHEHGLYDLPAIIDTVLKQTKAVKLNAIAHSQGNTIFYVLCSTRPEYNDRVNILISLAPVAFLNNVRQPIRSLIKSAPLINSILNKLNIDKVFAEPNIKVRKFCTRPIVGYIGCAHTILFPLLGYNSEELEPGFAQIVAGHVPTGTSRKNLYHFAQVGMRRKFVQYDYGTYGNLQKYNRLSPPSYNLSSVTTKVALYVGANDKVSTVEDVEQLRRKLPNVVKFLVVGDRKMAHADFVWGRRMNEYLFPHIFKVLQKYENHEKT